MWQTVRTSVLNRHAHQHAYAALVLSGGYEEAGDLGRFQVQAGDVVLHGGFEAHLNRFCFAEAKILNMLIPSGCRFRPGLMSVPDPDQIVRIAEKNRAEAAILLVSLARPKDQCWADWPDALAASLIEDTSLRLDKWSEMKRIAPWSISRGFAQVFGISPSGFRARMRARRAWNAICTTSESLVKISADLEFSDQAHMTRSVKTLTGRGPRAWRSAANKFKTN